MNNKRIAVLLATIMAVSMVAMGFVGGAAAETVPDDGDTNIAISPATSDTDDAQLVITHTVGSDETDVELGDDAEFTIDFPEGPDNLDPSDVSEDSSAISVTLIDRDADPNEVSRLDEDESHELDSVSTSTDQVTFDLDNDVVPVDGSTPEEGDILRVVIGDSSSDDGIDIHEDANEEENVDFEVDGDDGNTLGTDDYVELDGSAPISFNEELTDAHADNEDVEHTSSLASAAELLETAEQDDVTVTVEQDVDELATEPTPIGSGNDDGFSLTAEVDGDNDGELTDAQATFDRDDTEISGDDVTVEFVTTDQGVDADDNAIEIDNPDDVTVDGIDLEGPDTLDDNVSTAIDVASDADNFEVTDSDIDFFTADDGAVIEAGDVADLTVTSVEVDDGESGAGYAGITVATVEEGSEDIEHLDIDEVEISNLYDGTGIEVSDLEDGSQVVANISDTTAEGEDSATGFDIGATSNNDDTVDLEDVEFDGAGSTDGVGIQVTSDNDVDVLIHGAETEIGDADVGIDTDSVDGEFFNISDATLEDIDTTAIAIDDADPDETVTIDGVTVEGTGDENAIVVDDENVDVDIIGSALGTGDDEVDVGVEIAEAADDVAVEDSTVEVDDDGQGIQDDSPGSAYTLTVDESTITGAAAGDTEGIILTDGHSDLVIGDSDTTEISDIDDGIVIGVDGVIESDELDGEYLDLTGLDAAGIHVDNYDSELTINDVTVEDSGTGVLYDDDGFTLTVDGATLGDSDGDGAVTTGIEAAAAVGDDELNVDDTDIEVEADSSAVGVDLTASYSADLGVNVQDESEIVVGDEATGVHVDNDDVDLTVEASTIEAAPGDPSSGTVGVLSDDGSADVEVRFNDILGFTDDGLGVDDSAGALDEEDATGNWWGSDFGPQHEDASNVFVDVDAGASDAAIYDPFLTEEIEETDLDLSGPAASDVTSFAHDIYVEAGEIETVGFPSYSANELSEGEAYELIDGGEADIVRYDAADQEWFGAAEADETPEGLDAYAVISDDTDVLLKIEYEDELETTRGSYTYEEGFNLVPTAASHDDIGSTDEVTASNTFDLAKEDDGEFTTGFESPGLQMTPSEQLDTATDGSAIDGRISEVSAFHPMWVFVNEDDTIDRKVSAAFDSDSNMQTVLDDIEQ